MSGRRRLAIGAEESVSYAGFDSTLRSRSQGRIWPLIMLAVNCFLGGAAVGAVIVPAVYLVDGVKDPTSGMSMAIPVMLLASKSVGALAGAVSRLWPRSGLRGACEFP
jgi:hypothetical protein